MLSVDWLQINAKPKNVNDEGYPVFKDNDRYTIVLTDKHARNFRNIYQVFDKDKDNVAVITTHNNFPDAPKDMTIIKIINHKLYERGLKQFVQHLLDGLECVFDSYSRFDLCYDFTHFTAEDGTEFNPQAFLHEYVSGAIIKTDKSKIKMFSKNMGQDGLICESIKVGSESSNCSYGMYNKTEEMIAKQDKPYIREAWSKNYHANLKKDLPVYRIEFSIKADEVLHVVDSITGEAYNLRQLGLGMLDRIKEIYEAMFFKYWDFRINDYQKNVSRKKKFCFFKNFELQTYIIKAVRLSKDTNRGIKQRVSMLCTLNHELRSINAENPFHDNIVGSLDYIIRREIANNDLKQWAKSNPRVPIDIF